VVRVFRGSPHPFKMGKNAKKAAFHMAGRIYPVVFAQNGKNSTADPIRSVTNPIRSVAFLIRSVINLISFAALLLRSAINLIEPSRFF
jgi:hypothetical protein